MTEITPTGCCPPFDPTTRDDQIIEWHNKLFIKDKVFCILNMPANFGKVMTRIMSKANKHGATVPDAMCLSDHASAWKMNVFVAVDKKIPDLKTVKITGKFYYRVYEGDFRKTGEWISDFKKTSSEKHFSTGKMYMWYTTCPKCAKTYGKNYVVILSKIK